MDHESFDVELGVSAWTRDGDVIAVEDTPEMRELDRSTRYPAIQVVMARGLSRMAHVCDLVNKCYSARGYHIEADPYLPFPDSQRAAYYFPLLAFRNGKAVGTVTLGIDSNGGLLVDEVNRTEVDRVRGEGRIVCEMVRLAVDDLTSSRDVLGALFEQLFRLATQLRSLTDLFVEVNPKHSAFYCRVFGFEVVAANRTCPRVGAPSVLLRLTREEVERRNLVNCDFDVPVPRRNRPSPVRESGVAASA